MRHLLFANPHVIQPHTDRYNFSRAEKRQSPFRPCAIRKLGEQHAVDIERELIAGDVDSQRIDRIIAGVDGFDLCPAHDVLIAVVLEASDIIAAVVADHEGDEVLFVLIAQPNAHPRGDIREAARTDDRLNPSVAEGEAA